MSRIDDINAILDGFDVSATYDEVEFALRDFGQRELIGVLADRAAAGGGGPAQAFSGVSLRRSADQTGIPVGSAQDIVWQTADYDTDDYFDALAASSAMVPDDGIYLVTVCTVGIDDDGVDGQAYLAVTYTGGGVGPTAEGRYDGTEQEFGLILSDVVALSAGDTISTTINFRPATGGTTFSLYSAGTRFTVTKLGELPA